MLALAAVLLIIGTAVFGMLPANVALASPAGNTLAPPTSAGVADPVLEGGPQIGAKYAIVMEVGSGALRGLSALNAQVRRPTNRARRKRIPSAQDLPTKAVVFAAAFSF